jgi:D-aspartate ligase
MQNSKRLPEPGCAPPARLFDRGVPALVFKISRNPMHHGTLAVIRSLGTMGVPVYAAVEDRATPVAVSRRLAGCFRWTAFEPGAKSLVPRLLEIARQLGRAAVLVPTDDLAAALVAENASALEPCFLFPRVQQGLPRLLANKRELHALCASLSVPCPATTSPGSLEDVDAFIECARFPVIVKAADANAMPEGGRSVSIIPSPAQLLALYRQTPVPHRANLVLQEYIPAGDAEDWVFHAYANPRSGCLLCFTGKKLRSYPPFAGPTSLGVSQTNPQLIEQTIRLLKAINYAGIVDLDYRFDRRDGQYKLLDFNPRIGANFRMFENQAGVDVVRALHLDLTGRPVPGAPRKEGRKFILESHDWLASLGYAFQGELTWTDWLSSLKGSREFAWFRADDPAPAFLMGVRMLARTTLRVLGTVWSRCSAPIAAAKLLRRPLRVELEMEAAAREAKSLGELVSRSTGQSSG